MPGAARGDGAGTIELMRGEGLVVLPVAQRNALIVEGGQGAVENFERGQFFFLGDDR